MLGICLSLCPNIATAPELGVFAVAVVACPPLALLLAVQLLNRTLKRHRAETASETSTKTGETCEIGGEAATPVVRLAVTSGECRPPAEPTAEQPMWAYFVTERSKSRIRPAQSWDRLAGTNSYGRRVLRRWKDAGADRHQPLGERRQRETARVSRWSGFAPRRFEVRVSHDSIHLLDTRSTIIQQ